MLRNAFQQSDVITFTQFLGHYTAHKLYWLEILYTGPCYIVHYFIFFGYLQIFDVYELFVLEKIEILIFVCQKRKRRKSELAIL